MSTMILPDRRLVRHPNLILPNPSAPVIWSDGGFSREHGEEAMRILFYMIRDDGNAHVTATVMMSRSAFIKAALIEATEVFPQILGDGLPYPGGFN